MDEQSLRVFLSLVQTENTRDSGEILGINHSKVSRALARIEEQVGAELFTRNGRRLVLNHRGEALRADAAAVLDAMDKVRSHAEAIAREAEMIRIGFLHSLARKVVPEAVARFRQKNPTTRISLRQGFGKDLYAWLDSGTIDVALCTPPTAPRGNFEWATIAHERLCLVVPLGHRLAKQKEATVRDINGEDFIGFSRATEMSHLVNARLEAEKVEVVVTFESSEIETMRALVAGGLGVAILPQPVGRMDQGLVYIPLEPAAFREIGVAWSGSNRSAAQLNDFVDAAVRSADNAMI
jgi:LysR family transcriptional regulator, transcription activator of glutamate synthase operon